MARTLAWPVRIEDGDFATVEVGSIEEAQQNVGVLSQTILGERWVHPKLLEYGVPDPTGERGWDPQPLIDAAGEWIPGVTVTARPQPADRRDITAIVEVSR